MPVVIRGYENGHENFYHPFVDSDDGDPVFWDVDPPAKQVNV